MMTLHFSNKDGRFEASTTDEIIMSEGVPCLAGLFSVELDEREEAIARDILDNRPGDIFHTGKSTLGQARVDFEIDLRNAEISQTGSLQAQSRILNYSPHRWLKIIKETGIKLGKLGLPLEGHLALNRGEVMDAVKSGLIRLPNFNREAPDIAEDGKTYLGVEPGIEWILPDNLENYEIESMIREGRMGISRLQGIRAAQNVNKVLGAGESFVGGMKLSLIGHSAIVGDDVENSIKHYEARRLDGDRTTGTLGNRDATKLVQVEIRNEGEGDVEIDQIRLPVEFHDVGDTVGKTLLPGWSPSHIERVHKEGMNLPDVIDFTDEMVNSMFTPLVNGTDSIVIRKSGMCTVPDEEIYNWQKSAQIRGVRSSELEPAHGSYEALRGALKSTHEQGAIMITKSLGSIAHLEDLYRSGVRHLFVEEMNMTRPGHDNRDRDEDRGDLYLDAGKHKKLIDLSNKGMKFFWRPKLVNGETPAMRIFYKGTWTLLDEGTRDLVNRVNYEGASIAMFGSSVDEGEGNNLENEIDTFIGRLGKKFKGNLGVIHGNGPSVMAMADRCARKHELLSIGMGMDFEQIGETPNFEPQQLLLFKDDEIEYRQTDFERRKTVPIFNLGGKGTLFELALSFLKLGLQSSVPVPIVLVDPTNEFWTGFIKQVETMAQSEIGAYKFARPLTQEWTSKVFKVVSNYEEAAQVIEAFHDEPEDFWTGIGISDEELENAFKNQLALYEDYRVGVPKFLAKSFSKRGLTQ